MIIQYMPPPLPPLPPVQPRVMHQSPLGYVNPQPRAPIIRPALGQALPPGTIAFGNPLCIPIALALRIIPGISTAKNSLCKSQEGRDEIKKMVVDGIEKYPALKNDSVIRDAGPNFAVACLCEGVDIDPNAKPPPDKKDDSKSGGGLSTGTVVAIGLGLLALVGGGIFFARSRKKR